MWKTSSCTKRLHRSEIPFAAEHAHLHAALAWYNDLMIEDAAELVDVPVDVTDERLCVIEQLASGAYNERYTFAAVSQKIRPITGYVYATFCEQTRHICHCKVDRSHQGRSLGRGGK